MGRDGTGWDDTVEGQDGMIGQDGISSGLPRNPRAHPNPILIPSLSHSAVPNHIANIPQFFQHILCALGGWDVTGWYEPQGCLPRLYVPNSLARSSESLRVV